MSLAARSLPTLAAAPTAAIASLSPLNIGWLLVSLALVTAPHALRLPLWIAPLAVAFALWRLHIARHGLAMPHKTALYLLSAASTAAVYLSYGDLLGRDAGVALLVVMLALKLLETTRLRDAMLLLLLGYFLVITNFLYSQSIPTALYMLVAVLAITATMVNFHHGGSARAARNTVRVAVLLLAQAAPLMLVLFVLFPRVPAPLWGTPQQTHGSTGLSDTMAPGSVSALSLSPATAFRVKFEDGLPPPSALYWRGPVLWHFDGRTWSAGRSESGESQARYTAKSAPIRYTVTLEPHQKPRLFALDLPASLPGQARLTDDFQIVADSAVQTRMRYQIASVLDYRAGLSAGDAELQRALQMPERSNPRARELAAELRAWGDDKDIVRAALTLFREQPFFYTLSPPRLGDQPVDEFLFDTRRGFCEHFASSFVFLMRGAGVPARVVTGYQGGELNPVDNYLVVRQADAHAWAEVWLRGQGWVRVDPTAAVSPLRIEQGVAAALPENDALMLPGIGAGNWLQPARLTWDAAGNGWNQWVLGYDASRQLQVLAGVGLGAASWRTMTIALIAIASAVTLVLGVVLLRQRRSLQRDPVISAYRKFCDKLAATGVARRDGEGPRDFATRAIVACPQDAIAIDAISKLYVEARYSASPDRASIDRLTLLVKRFKVQKRPPTDRLAPEAT